MNQEDQPKTKKCPFCAEEILADAVKCKHCGEWLDKPAIAMQRTKMIPQYSNAQAPWRLVLLSILSLGIYDIYWFFRNWKHLKSNKDLNISPGWRTVGLFVPIYNVVLIYRQFRNIRDLARGVGCETYSSPGWLVFVYIFLGPMLGRLVASNMLQQEMTSQNVTWFSDLFISIIGLILLVSPRLYALVVVQEALNNFWGEEQPGLPTRPKFSRGEIALLVIGGIVWILSVIGISMPA